MIIQWWRDDHPHSKNRCVISEEGCNGSTFENLYQNVRSGDNAAVVNLTFAGDEYAISAHGCGDALCEVEEDRYAQPCFHGQNGVIDLNIAGNCIE